MACPEEREVLMLDQPADVNREIAQRMFDAVDRGDRETVDSLHHPAFVVHMTHGLEGGGIFTGAVEMGEERARIKSLLGITHVGLKELVADGPTRVVAILEVAGTDAAGATWSMPFVELMKVVDNKITEKRVFFLDTARLREIADERQASGL